MSFIHKRYEIIVEIRQIPISFHHNSDDCLEWLVKRSPRSTSSLFIFFFKKICTHTLAECVEETFMYLSMMSSSKMLQKKSSSEDIFHLTWQWTRYSSLTFFFLAHPLTRQNHNDCRRYFMWWCKEKVLKFPHGNFLYVFSR